MVFIAIESNYMLTKIGNSFQQYVSYYVGITVELEYKKYDSNNVSCQNVSVSVYFLMESVWQCQITTVLL